MHSTVMLIALRMLVLPASVMDSPVWETDYAKAKSLSERKKKPLAVVFATGATGWDKVSREGGLDKNARQLLARKYVCLYMNLEDRNNKKLAEAMKVSQESGMVISDRTCAYLAFRHQGDLANADIHRYLERYSDPSREFRETETNPDSHVSYYEPPAQPAASQRPVYSTRSC